MLLGKLATPATKVYQVDPLTTQTATAEYMVVMATRFVIGKPTVNFELRFGNIIVENEKERFDIVVRHNIKMTQEELSSWGTDDAVVLDLIAAKLNTSIVEKVQKDFHQTN